MQRFAKRVKRPGYQELVHGPVFFVDLTERAVMVMGELKWDETYDSKKERSRSSPVHNLIKSSWCTVLPAGFLEKILIKRSRHFFAAAEYAVICARC
jgi:hypothetical protein